METTVETEMIEVSSDVGKTVDFAVTEDSKSNVDEEETENDKNDTGEDDIIDDDDENYSSGEFSAESDVTETDTSKTKSRCGNQKAKPKSDSKGNEKRHACDVCKMRFTYRVQLKTHKRSHTGEKPFQCSVCKKAFSHNVNLTTHMRLHTGEKPYSCNVCDRSFTHSNTLKMHMRIHTGERPYRCTVCEECFLRSDQLKRHMTIHTGVKPYNCKFCSRSFTQIDSLKMHMEKHTDDKPYECGICHKSFASVVTLKRHMRNHDEKNFKCDLCDSKYVFKTELKRHIATRHTEERPYKCSICEKAYFLSCNLTTHMFTHMGEKPFKCSFCEKKFSSASNLGSHKRKEHTKQGLHPCHECGGEFPQPSALRKHMLTHKRERRHTCTVCSKTFPLAGSLKVHMRSHSVDKPFTCPVCEKGFGYRHHLKRHRKIHEYNTVQSTKKEKHNGESQCGSPRTDQPSGISGDSSQDECNVTLVKVEPVDLVNQSEIPELSLTSKTVTYACDDNDASLVNGLSRQSNLSQNGTLSIICQSNGDKTIFRCPVCDLENRNKQLLLTHMKLHDSSQCSDDQFNLRNSIKQKPKTTLRLLMEQFQHPPKNTQKRKLLPKNLSGTEDAEKTSVYSQLEKQNSFSSKKKRPKSRGDPVTCPVCEKAFIYAKSLDKHMAQHSKVSNFVCKTCGEDFVDSSALLLHAESHKQVNTESLPEAEDIKQFICQVCCHVFTDISALTNHERTHKPSQQSIFNCSSCEEDFINEELLRIHEKVHNKQDVDIKPFPCHECSEAFRTTNALRSHQALEHVPDLRSLKLFPCFKCGERFGNADALKSHSAQHDAPSSELSPCSSLLKQHKQQHDIQLEQEIQTFGNKSILTGNQSTSEPHKISNKQISVTTDEGLVSNNDDNHNYPITKSILCGAIPFQQDMNQKDRSSTSFSSMTSRNCKTCGETFTNLIALRLHELDHSHIDLTGKR